MKRTFITLAGILAALAIGVAEPAHAKKCRGMSACQFKKAVEDTGEAARRAAEAAREAARKAEEAAREAARKTEEAALETAKRDKLLRDAAELAQKAARERDEAAREIRRREEEAARQIRDREPGFRKKAEKARKRLTRAELQALSEFSKLFASGATRNRNGDMQKEGGGTVKESNEQKGSPDKRGKSTDQTKTQQPSQQEQWRQYWQNARSPARQTYYQRDQGWGWERRREPTYYQRPRSTMEYDYPPNYDLPEQSEPGYPRQPSVRPQGPARIYTR